MIPYFVFDTIPFGFIKIHTWGLMVGLGFSIGYLWVLFRGRQKGISAGKIAGLALTIFAGAVLGSRLLYLLQTPWQFLADVSLLWRIDQGGLMMWGGIFGAVFFGLTYIRLTKLDFWRVADLVAPAIALGIGIGRLGCFLINDHMGAATNLPWGILWPDGIARHPVALYESLAGLGSFVMLLILEKYIYKIHPSPPLLKEGANAGSSLFKERLGGILQLPGNLFLLFLVSYAIIRFFLDFLRASSGPLADPRWWGLTSSQWISVVLVIILLAIYYKNKRNKIAVH